jgi:hypothetical protein
MHILPVPVELPFDVTIQCPHHSYPGEHRWPAALSDQQQQRFHRGLPFLGIVFGLREHGDVGCGVAESDERLALGQFDWVVKWLVPRHLQLFPKNVTSVRGLAHDYITSALFELFA